MTIPISISLLQTAVKLFAIVAVARALLQYLDADFHNFISQFIYRVTLLPIKLLRIFVPRIGGRDHATPLALAVLTAGCERYLFIVGTGNEIDVFGLVVLTIARVIEFGIGLMVVAVLALVVLSWVSKRITDVYRLVLTLTEPLILPVRRRLPSFGTLDFSPIVVLLLLELTEWLIVGSLEAAGYRMFL